ncbi:hypothetical protein [Pontibacillus yanchengensis]|uniref:Uncharacterized protein n=1 Tax=Pontibacillus yanchengensis Y32 TaxID=1385514 RepID=A0A0A2TS22_9BACI|nr:hypothetical protein [Pontibacillus yanchengensis]KGP72060.1 hypothetical protein N782_14370 [Pontibacillus yanchengensis Y32]
MMEFLYFPEDKTEYIPAVLTLLVFAIGAFITMKVILKASKKEEQKANEQFGDYMTPNQEQKSNQDSNTK